MLRWICRHHHHRLFMVMQGMHPLVERPDPHPDSSPVGTDMSHNPKHEVHHGRVRAVLSGNKHGPTGPMPVVPVQAEHPHSLLPVAHFQLEVIMTTLRGLTTSTFGLATSMKGHSRSTEHSTNTLKTPHDTARCNKQIMKPWKCFESSMKKLKLSTGTMVLPGARSVSQLGGKESRR